MNEITLRVSAIQDLTVNPILISAQHNINLDQLKQRVGRVLDTIYLLTLRLPMNDRSLSYLSELHEQVTVVQTEYEDRTVAIKLKCYSHYLEEIEGALSELNGQMVTCDPLILS